MITLLASVAFAGTVAVTTQVEGPHASASTVQSAAWHALVQAGHEPVVLGRDLVAAPEAMRAAGASALLDLAVRWHVDPRATADGLLRAPFPEVSVTEYELAGFELVPVRTWTRIEPPAVHQDPVLGWYTLPDRSLQRAITSALEPFAAAGDPARPELLLLPVIVAADEEYRERYGADWQHVADLRVQRASALLAPAGFELRVVQWQEWTSPDAEHDLTRLLHDLAGARRDSDALRIGLTGQIHLDRAGSAEDVGLAYSPGSDVLVGDLQLPELDPAWDLAEEGVVIAHELLHAVGIPHTIHPNLLMSESKQSAVHVLSEGTQELARTAVQVRRAHWDPVAALHALAHVADVRLVSPEAQVAYILANLAAGPGMPEPGEVKPETVSALVNVSMGRYYLERSRALPQEARALRQSALAHGVAALSEAPGLAAPLLAHLVPEHSEPAPAEAPAGSSLACRDIANPWDLVQCMQP